MVSTEGFWRHADDRNSDLPFPEAGEQWNGQQEFLARLEEVEARARNLSYRGWSNCRLCGQANGSQTYDHAGWQWPSGYAHYLRDHNVRPSAEFAAFIMAA